MFSSTLKRSVATLGVLAGLLAAAVPASAQGGEAVVTMGGGKDRGDFTVDIAAEKLGAAGGYGERGIYARSEDRPQRGIILAGTGDDQMVTDTQQGQVPQQDRAITMLDYSLKDSPQAGLSPDFGVYASYSADSNEVAVEGITLAHEGFEIQAVGTRGGGEVISEAPVRPPSQSPTYRPTEELRGSYN
jgi:hypothetical protein